MWGGRVSIISTHNGVESDYNKLIEDCRKGEVDYSLHRVTLDDALEDGLFRRIAMVLGLPWSPETEAKWRQDLIDFYGADAQEELFCVPAKSGGVYIGQGLVESVMVPGKVVRLELPDSFTHKPEQYRTAEIDRWCKRELSLLLARLDKKRLHYFGEDFGRVSDLTVIAPVVLSQDLVRRVPFLVELRRVPFEQQRQILFFIADRLPRLSGGALDATGNGAYLAEVAAQRYGENVIEQVNMTAPWYAENLPPFKAAHEEHRLEYPKDADVLEDVCSFELIDGLPRLPKAKKKGKSGGMRHGDAGIALLLAYTAARTEAQSYRYHGISTGRRKGL
jgi:phage FluMu gp28-like protein